MKVHLSAIPSAFHLPRPNWDVIGAWIERHVPSAEQPQAWDEVTREWLDTLREALSGPYRLEAVRLKSGLEEDGSADAEDAPDEYREAMQRSQAAWDALYAATVEEFGAHDLARLFREDEAHFDERYEAGRQFFHGPDDEDEK